VRSAGFFPLHSPAAGPFPLRHRDMVFFKFQLMCQMLETTGGFRFLSRLCQLAFASQ
jgi:hypothetical protein